MLYNSKYDFFGTSITLSVNWGLVVFAPWASYAVIISQVVVSAKATLIDLKNGKTLWSGQASASSSEEQSNSGGGLIGLLITAVVLQIVNNVSDNSHHIADIANQRLLTAGHHNGLLFGPRSAKYGTDWIIPIEVCAWVALSMRIPLHLISIYAFRRRSR